MNTLSLVWISELIKLRSVRSTWWAVSGAVLAMAVAAALDGTSTANELQAEAAAPGSTTYVSLAISGVNFVQFIVPVPAMLLITSEYASRSITFSLQCVPGRSRLLLGKAGIVAVFGFVVGTLLGVVGVAVGGVEREVQHVHQAAELLGVFGIQQAVAGDGGDEPHLAGQRQKIGQLTVQQRLAAREVNHRYPQALEVAQVLRHVFQRDIGRGFFPDVAKRALRIAAVRDVVVAKDRVANETHF